MSNLIKPKFFGGLLHSAPSLAGPHREQQQGIANRRPSERKNSEGSELARFAASTDGTKIGYGALAFWIVVAVLVAARVAFLDPSTFQTNSSLSGARATAAWTTGENPSSKN